jgi:hypothetical protein
VAGRFAADRDDVVGHLGPDLDVLEDVDTHRHAVVQGRLRPATHGLPELADALQLVVGHDPRAHRRLLGRQGALEVDVGNAAVAQ